VRGVDVGKLITKHLLQLEVLIPLVIVKFYVSTVTQKQEPSGVKQDLVNTVKGFNGGNITKRLTR
jgi:hypothetical protein